jgi:hypothetical protein
MEGPVARRGGAVNARGLAIVLAVVVLIRLPFLDQAIQGDDVYYLAAAQHAQIDPLHPNHVRYVFLGDEVDFRGHPHPPLDAWVLGLLLAAAGDIREVPFHAAFIVFSLIAAAAMWSLARRFSPHPVWAALLFVATPAFVVNGNSLESDLPFLAFWMASMALFCAGRFALAAGAMALAALGAYQAIFLTPILWVWCWMWRRKDRAAWAATLVPPATILAWQLFERFSTGALPATVLTGYFTTYGFQNLDRKIANAAALGVHAWFLVFPLLLPPAILMAWRKRDRDTVFLAAWVGIFFAGALAVFFAGSARYLLPMAAPVALLVSRLPVKWLAAGFAVWMPLGLGLAVVNYQHWDGYREFAETLRAHAGERRVWINGEWGLRYYLEANGGLALKKGQTMYPGDIVVSSELAYPVEFNDPVAPLVEAEIRPWLPLRLIGLESRSGYSTASKGFYPFGISTGPVDRVKAEIVVERKPVLEYLPMSASEQMVTGLYGLEGGRWRWMAQRAVVLVKSPESAKRLEVEFTIPGPSPARRMEIQLDGRPVASQTYSGPGSYTLASAPLRPEGASATVTLLTDKSFSVPGDRRELSVIVTGVGFR